MGFKNEDTYCVAPVTSRFHNLTARGRVVYDFWAVGTNCCSGNGNDFHCGDYTGKKARAGLRVMQDDLRGFFRLAVQQAESAYNIKAVHPIFLYWLEDPTFEARSYREDGFKYFMLGMFSHFSLQLVLVMLYVVFIMRS